MKTIQQTIRFIDLFSGMGGMRLAFETAAQALGVNTKCIQTAEIKDYAIKVLNHVFSENIEAVDINNIIPEKLEDFEVLLAGFPCQPFSAAGNNLGFEDTRGTLFFSIASILKTKKPKGFILENVANLLSQKHKKSFDRMIGILRELGYQVSWKALNSKHFGVPQDRKRVFIVGVLKENLENEIDSNPISLADFPIVSSLLEDVLQKGLPVVDSDFTKKLLKHYSVDDLAGKAIKDKRGGDDNIHSWDIDYNGPCSEAQKDLLSQILKNRRHKKWAEIIGVDWADGMPLTMEQIASFWAVSTRTFKTGLLQQETKKYTIDDHLSFFDSPIKNRIKDTLLACLQEMLDDLTEKKYLKLQHPTNKNPKGGRRIPDTSKPKGYNIVTGKLSFEFTSILNPKGVAPTLVATDLSKIGVVDGNGIRRLSARECLRISGYPETYSFPLDLEDTYIYDLIGNTIAVPVVQKIAERLLKSIVPKKNKKNS